MGNSLDLESSIVSELEGLSENAARRLRDQVKTMQELVNAQVMRHPGIFDTSEKKMRFISVEISSIIGDFYTRRAQGLENDNENKKPGIIVSLTSRGKERLMETLNRLTSPYTVDAINGVDGSHVRLPKGTYWMTYQKNIAIIYPDKSVDWPSSIELDKRTVIEVRGIHSKELWKNPNAVVL